MYQGTERRGRGYFFPEQTWFLFLKRIQRNPETPFQGHHSKFEFLGCERMQESPVGGGEAPPPGGSSAFFKQHSRNSNFEWWPWKGIFLDFLEIVLKPEIMKNMKLVRFQSPELSISANWSPNKSRKIPGFFRPKNLKFEENSDKTNPKIPCPSRNFNRFPIQTAGPQIKQRPT